MKITYKYTVNKEKLHIFYCHLTNKKEFNPKELMEKLKNANLNREGIFKILP